MIDFIEDYKMGKMIDSPAIRKLSYPSGYEWLGSLHDSNLPLSVKTSIVAQHHQSELMEKLIEVESKKNIWLTPTLIFISISICLILRGLF